MTQNPAKILLSTIPLAQLAVAACKAYGIQRVVISPGSRNAPLTLSFTADPFFDCYSIVDERAAAFFGLGMAQQTAVPTILICTSGSAVLNYFPAVAEAYYSDIPLVVLSADRPAARIDIGDGQTIRQEGVFGKHLAYQANCTADCGPTSANQKYFNEGLQIAIQSQKPIHFNLPFDEPLYEQTLESLVDFKMERSASIQNELTLTAEELKVWNEAERIMVLCGVMKPGSVDAQLLDAMLKDPRVLMLTETTSNLHHPKLVTGIDQLIAALDDEELDALKPDLLLSMGGMVVSKKIKALLREHAPKNHWHVDMLKAYDTFFVLSRHFENEPDQLLRRLQHSKEGTANYQPYWLAQRDRRRSNHTSYIKAIPYSDLKAYAMVLTELPSPCQLQVANSAAIRYTQLFELPGSIEIYCNRGTSGIDGSTSTAIGAGICSDKQVVFISGDLSFFYDSNALWNNYTPSNFKVILINNSGGGIFRILPGEKDNPTFDTYFETIHHLKADKLCEMYGWHYRAAYNEQEIKEHLTAEFWQQDGPGLLEIFTPRTENDTLLLNYFESVK